MEVIAFFSSRKNKKWLRVYTAQGCDGWVTWFETDDPSVLGVLTNMPHHQLMDWAARMAASWGRKHLVKMQDRMAQDYARMQAAAYPCARAA